MRFFKSTKDRKPLFTLKVYKRHILMFVLIIVAAIIGYGIYFRAFMVLPQSAVNILQELPLGLSDQKVMVIAPHCDDESLGAGGLVQKVISLKSDVEVVMVTDCNYQKIGSTRRAETVSALAELGVANDKIVFLNFPEKGENRKDEQQGDYQQINNALSKEIGLYNPTLIVSSHPEDTHIDHKTTGKIVDSITKEIYTSSGRKIPVIYYLVHYNFLEYPSPSGLHPNAFLMPPVRLLTLTDQWYKLSLSGDEENLKEDAILKYKSQIRKTNPILHIILLDFVRRNELFMIRS